MHASNTITGSSKTRILQDSNRYICISANNNMPEIHLQDKRAALKHSFCELKIFPLLATLLKTSDQRCTSNMSPKQNLMIVPK